MILFLKNMCKTLQKTQYVIAFEKAGQWRQEYKNIELCFFFYERLVGFLHWAFLKKEDFFESRVWTVKKKKSQLQ